MWTSIQDRPLAEVLVERDQCLSVRGCCRQDVFIPGISGPVADPLDLMTRGAQDRHRVNQPAAEFEDGSAEPGTSEVRIRFEQPLSHEAADRAMLLGRRADVRREFSRIHGSIAR